MTQQSMLVLVAVLLLSWVSRLVWHPVLRQGLLLAVSYIIYIQWAGPEFLLILIASSLLNYSLGVLLRRRQSVGLLWTGIILNAALLGFFKYLPAVANSDLLHRIILPLGISFWTFQGLSYLFDIYLEKELDPSLLEFCLYIAFWPTVTAGPVCRLTQMLPQFRKLTTSFRDDFSIGIVRLTQGLFMKFVLAELLGSGLMPGCGVNGGFDTIGIDRGALDVWALAVGYAFQLFFDFAGYSHMVIGVGRIMGFRVQENFDRPYLAPSPSVFWTRWHMSLSFWIRDYVYTPLATLRRSRWWPHAALLIAMTIFGIWHGAKLTYVCWGVYHGSLLVAHRFGQLLKRKYQIAPPRIVGLAFSWLTTFALVSVGYIFFRADDVGQAFRMLRAILTPDNYAARYMTLPREFYLLVVLMAGGYFVYAGFEELLRRWPAYKEKYASPTLVVIDGVVAARRWWLLAPILILLCAVTGLVFFGQSSNIAPFIYAIF